MARGGFDLDNVIGCHARRADDMHDARLRSQRRDFDGRRRRGEINHPVGLENRSKRVIGDRDPEPAQTDRFTGVPT